MKDKIVLFDRNKWIIIALNNVVFLMFWYAILNKNIGDVLNSSINFVTFYLLYIFLSSILIFKLRDRYVYMVLSTIILLSLSGFDFYNELMVHKPQLPVFSYPDILQDFYFYIYFPIIGSLLSSIISKVIFKNKNDPIKK